MLSSCGSDETGGFAGGVAGDQTGGEYAVVPWYRYPSASGWRCVLRHPLRRVGDDIAYLAEAAADNDLIGYDQWQRLTFWNLLHAAPTNDPAEICEPCEADCSSSTAAIVKAAGLRAGIPELAAVSPSLTTYYMRDALANAGFAVLEDERYLTSDEHLLPGDILLEDDWHVVINLSAGSASEGTPLEDDGWWGRATTARLQEVLGSEADGEVWHQYCETCCDERQTGGWQYDETLLGSPVIRRLQEVLGVERDGLWGPICRERLMARYNVATYADAVAEMQRRLNEGSV